MHPATETIAAATWAQPSKEDADRRCKAAEAYARKLSWKRKEAIQLANTVKDWLRAYKDVDLPYSYREYKAKRAHIWDYDAYGTEMEDDLGELAKMHYQLLSTGWTVGALFENDGSTALVPAATWYSRHRLDPVWNWRKSQLIRKAYREYLQSSGIHRQYQPVHLVLTWRHSKVDGFYAKEIVKSFNLMRKEKWFKDMVWGGEYGLEVTQTGNGYHIHIHSLCFQHRSYRVNQVRDRIKQWWSKRNDADFIHYETLYKWQRDEQGQRRYYERMCSVFTEDGEFLRTEAHREYLKEYVGPDTELDDYLEAVMECIKYHFKQASFVDETTGGYDVGFINEVLKNTKGLRMYSKFGGLYGVKELNFNNLSANGPPTEDVAEDTETLKLDCPDDSGSDEDPMGSVANLEKQLVNPLTKQWARPGEYRLVMFRPEWLNYAGKSALHPNRMLSDPRGCVQYLPKSWSLEQISQVMQAICMGTIHDLTTKTRTRELVPEAYGALDLN